MQRIEEEFFSDELAHEPITDTKVELARQLFVSLETQVQLADRKVQAVFGLNAFLVAALSLQNQSSFQSMLQNKITVSVGVDLFFKASLLGCVCMATWSALKALSPRVKALESQSESKPSLFFFGDIHAQSLPQFATSFIGLTNEEAVMELLSSAHSISGILTIKYKMLRRSTLLLSLGLLLWILLQVNKFLG